MTKGKRGFQKGNTHGKYGRPPLTFEQFAIKEMSSQLFAEFLIKLKDMTRDQLQVFHDSPDITVFQKALAKVLLNASEGNLGALDMLLIRMIGRPKEVVELTGSGGGPLEVKNMTDEQIEKKFNELKSKS